MVVINVKMQSLLQRAQYISDKLAVGGDAYDAVMRICASTAHADISKRIFEKGLAADGSKIGEYSTNPIYVSSENSTKKLAASGKNSTKPTFKNGNQRKSRYFAGGYNQFKTEIGRNKLGSVNLFLSGQLANQFAIVKTSRGYGLGWSNTEMFERVGHLEKKYGKKIFAMTEDELKNAQSVAESELSVKLELTQS